MSATFPEKESHGLQPWEDVNEPVMGSAMISECGEYRYELWRSIQEYGPVLCWIMLNPSTADGSKDDPTIRRVVNFTRREGYSCAVVINLFALRSSAPILLRTHPDPIGPENDVIIEKWVDYGCPIICAWGAGGQKRAAEVLAGPLRNANLWCLGTTKDGSPRHPLYVRGDQPLVPFRRVTLNGPR